MEPQKLNFLNGTSLGTSFDISRYLRDIYFDVVWEYHQGAHKEIFEGGLNFLKSNPYLIAVNLVIVKEGFAVIVASLQDLLIQNLVITILKIVGCEDRVLDSNLPLSGMRQSPSHWAIVTTFSKKFSHFNAIWMTFCTFLEQLEKAELLRFFGEQSLQPLPTE